ncbi:hypothetical protein IT568_09215 [bacterium]|nr:hypothetical protein [bacterium]
MSLLCLFLTFSSIAFAEECDAWICSQEGYFRNAGSFSDSGPFNVAIGQAFTKPTVTGTDVSPGQKKRTCKIAPSSPDHPEGEEWEETAEVSYTTSIVWEPEVPASFDSAGTYTYTAKVKGTASEVCSDIEDYVGTITVDVGYKCDTNGDGTNDANWLCSSSESGSKDACYLCDHNQDGIKETCEQPCPGKECYVCDEDGDGTLDVCKGKKLTGEDHCDKITATPFDGSIKQYIEGPLNAIPFLEDVTAEINVNLEACDCCKPPVITRNLAAGTGEISGGISAGATVSGAFPVPALGFHLNKVVNLSWFRIRISATLKGGVTLHPSVSVTGTANVQKTCEENLCYELGINAGGSIQAEVGAEAKLCYKREMQPGSCPIDITLPTVFANGGLSGTMQWNSCSGINGQACLDPINAGVKVDLPWIGEWEHSIEIWGGVCYP